MGGITSKVDPKSGKGEGSGGVAAGGGSGHVAGQGVVVKCTSAVSNEMILESSKANASMVVYPARLPLRKAPENARLTGSAVTSLSLDTTASIIVHLLGSAISSVPKQ
jgi:hypothetical protein